MSFTPADLLTSTADTFHLAYLAALPKGASPDLHTSTEPSFCPETPHQDCWVGVSTAGQQTRAPSTFLAHSPSQGPPPFLIYTPSLTSSMRSGLSGSDGSVRDTRRPLDRCYTETVHSMGYSGQVFKSLSTKKMSFRMRCELQS